MFSDSRFAYSFTDHPPYEDVRDTLAHLSPGDEVVCEQGPSIRRQADTCEPVESLVRELAETVHWVRPTSWKPSPLSTVPAGTLRTRHERDAARMGRWFLTRREASRAAPTAST